MCAVAAGCINGIIIMSHTSLMATAAHLYIRNVTATFLCVYYYTLHVRV